MLTSLPSSHFAVRTMFASLVVLSVSDLHTFPNRHPHTLILLRQATPGSRRRV